ncbi:MAG TPA: Hpt domain-containing protein [Aestuariivirgaceae bacterium]|nr:Hpt domain-containing protein [Aestuariivirgaceae bacterium]
MAPEHSLRREKYVHEPEPSSESVPESLTESLTESGAGPEVLDLDHLARYTMGNRDLERELLRLFRTQLLAQMTGVAQARDAPDRDGQDWRFATHTLKGVARSIGAWAIADTAEKLEQLGHDSDDSGVYGRLMVDLAAQIAACEREIARIVGR